VARIAGLSIGIDSISFLPSVGGELHLAAMANEGSGSATIRVLDLTTGSQVTGNSTGTGYGGFVLADPDTPGLVFFQATHCDGKVYLFDTRIAGSSGPARSFLGMGVDAYTPLHFTRMSLSGSGATQKLSSHQHDLAKVWDVGTGRSLLTLHNNPNQRESNTYAGITDHCFVAVRRDSSAHVWMLNGSTDDGPASFSLPNAAIARNSPACWSGTMNSRSIFLGTTTGLLHGTWGTGPVRAW